eukprot:4172122-Ditylum_brightwellii.AAC.1
MNIENEDDDPDYKGPEPNKDNDHYPETETSFKAGVAQHDNQTSGIPLNYHEKQEDDNKKDLERRMRNLEK